MLFVFHIFRYRAKDQGDIGKYVPQHRVITVGCYFSRKLGVKVSKTTDASILKAYLNEVKENKRAREDDESATALHPKKRGRRVLLGEDLDQKVHMYLMKVREEGGGVSARIAMAAAKGILLTCDRDMFVEFGSHVQLNKAWTYSLLYRMKFVQRNVSTAASKHSGAHFEAKKQQFLRGVADTVEMEEVPAELVINWDQTGITIVPSNTWTME